MSEKYDYKYVRIKLEVSFWSGKFNKNYQDSINQHAEEGWRFVQVFAPAVTGYGAAKFMDLIFERKRE